MFDLAKTSDAMFWRSEKDLEKTHGNCPPDGKYRFVRLTMTEVKFLVAVNQYWSLTRRMRFFEMNPSNDTRTTCGVS